MGYIFIDNNSKDTQLTVNIFIHDVKSTVFYPSLKYKRAELVVMPGRQKILVFRMCGSAAKLQFNERFHFVKDFTRNAAVVRQKGTWVARLVEGVDKGIGAHILRLDDAIVYLFENNS